MGQGCRKDDIGACSPQQVRDSYDNSIAYTDKVLADAIDVLNEAKGIDTVLLYVSDHGGEFRGEGTVVARSSILYGALRANTCADDSPDERKSANSDFPLMNISWESSEAATVKSR